MACESLKWHEDIESKTNCPTHPLIYSLTLIQSLDTVPGYYLDAGKQRLVRLGPARKGSKNCGKRYICKQLNERDECCNKASIKILQEHRERIGNYLGGSRKVHKGDNIRSYRVSRNFSGVEGVKAFQIKGAACTKHRGVCPRNGTNSRTSV